MSPSNKARKKEVLKVLEEMQYTYVDWNCLNNDSVKKYSKQLELYKEALEEALNKKVKKVYIYSVYLEKTIEI